MTWTLQLMGHHDDTAKVASLLADIKAAIAEFKENGGTISGTWGPEQATEAL